MIACGCGWNLIELWSKIRGLAFVLGVSLSRIWATSMLKVESSHKANMFHVESCWSQNEDIGRKKCTETGPAHRVNQHWHGTAPYNLPGIKAFYISTLLILRAKPYTPQVFTFTQSLPGWSLRWCRSLGESPASKAKKNAGVRNEIISWHKSQKGNTLASKA